jgi:hypothetical protein
MNNKYYLWHLATVKWQTVKKYSDQRWVRSSDSMYCWFFIDFEHSGCFEQSLGNAMRQAAFFSRVAPLFYAFLSLTILSQKALFFKDDTFTFGSAVYGVEWVFPLSQLHLRNKSSFFAVISFWFWLRKLCCKLMLLFICYLCLDFTQNFVKFFSILHDRAMGS